VISTSKVKRGIFLTNKDKKVFHPLQYFLVIFKLWLINSRLEALKQMKKISTSDVNQHRFEAHGLVEVTIAENIVHYEARGSFNDELGAAFGAVQEHVLPKMEALKP